ncbi:hypothetical protein STPL106120_06295 [Streptococcus pluranimalium]|uniref:hypothetical protein n=1 Tax=Streptococcus pluranimalium TaxID=82348 RepID=UPI0039ECEACF
MTWSTIFLIAIIVLILLFLRKDSQRRTQLGQQKLQDILANENMNDLSNRYHSGAGVALVKKLREDFDLDLLSAKQLADKIQEQR